MGRRRDASSYTASGGQASKAGVRVMADAGQRSIERLGMRADEGFGRRKDVLVEPAAQLVGVLTDPLRGQEHLGQERIAKVNLAVLVNEKGAHHECRLRILIGWGGAQSPAARRVERGKSCNEASIAAAQLLEVPPHAHDPTI